MQPFLNRLSTRIALLTIGFLGLLAAVTALLLHAGFRDMERTATSQSIMSLEQQGQDTVRTLVVREAELTAQYFQQPAQASRIAAQALSATLEQEDSVTTTVRLTRRADGSFTSAVPNRHSALFVPAFATPDDVAIQHEVQLSAPLDTLAPTMLEQLPQAVALYYAGTHDVYRYYPPDQFEGYVPANWRATNEPWFDPTAPTANPTGATTWSSLYLDDFGHGLMVTTCTPVYAMTTFDGMVCLDVTLQQMIAYLTQVQPTSNSYAFLADNTGQIIAGSPTAVTALTGFDDIPLPEDNNDLIGLSINDPQIQDVVQTGDQTVHTLETLSGPAFLVVATVPEIDWRLGIMAPVADVTAQAAPVTAAIQAGTTATFWSTLLTIGGFLLLALLGVLMLSRQVTHPIARLVAATQQMAAGDLDTRVSAHRQDEIGLLAQRFNTMAEALQARSAAERAAQAERLRLQDEILQFQEARLHELASPLIPIADTVVLMPLIGTMDSGRAQQMMETLLTGVAQQNAHLAIIDITGVSVIDTQVAQALIQTAQAVKLLGAQVMLTGIRPQVAQTLVQLGADLPGIVTYGTLQSGIAAALRGRSRGEGDVR